MRLPQIGSIVRDGTGNSFTVGPLVETSSGPYTSAAEFYDDYPAARGRNVDEENGVVAGQTELVQAFRSLATSFQRSEDGEATGFGLVNFDLNPNNVLVDCEFNVLAVIDWDSVVTVHDAAVYRFPAGMGVGAVVPGAVATGPDPGEVERQPRGRRFAGVVEAVAREMAEDADGQGKADKRGLTLFARERFFLCEAVAFRALADVKMREDSVNRERLEGLKWLGEHGDEELAKFFSWRFRELLTHCNEMSSCPHDDFTGVDVSELIIWW